MVNYQLKIGTQGPIFPPFENVVKTVKKLDELYDSIWWPDHLMGWIPDVLWKPEKIEIAKFQNSPHIFLETFTLMASVACHTSKASLGSLVTESFRRHPAMIAQTFLTLDHISKGRAILGIGAGEAENIVPYGLNWKSPARRLEECIEIIRLLWSGKKINYDGKVWKLKDAILSLSPEKEGKYPEIWVGAHSKKTLEITGRLGDGWIPEHLEIDDYLSKLGNIRHAAMKSGRDPDDITPGMFTSMILCEEHEECHKLFNSTAAKAYALISPAETYEKYGYKHPLGLLNAYKEYIPTKVDEAEILKAINEIPEEICAHRYLHGNVDEVIKQIEEYALKGLKHIVLWNLTPMCDYKKTKESFTSLLKVVEYFKDVR